MYGCPGAGGIKIPHNLHYVVRRKISGAGHENSDKKIQKASARSVLPDFSGVMDYPFLSRLYNDRVQGQAVVSQEKPSGILESRGGSSAAKGAGHLKGSSLPVGGESTHALLSAHRGLVQKKMFTNLDEVKKGDMFLLHILGDTLCYRVRDTRVVKPNQVESLKIHPGEDLVTLITCTPYGLNTHRLLVEGEWIPYTPEVEEEIARAEKLFALKDWWWAVVSLILIIVMTALLVRYVRAGKKTV